MTHNLQRDTGDESSVSALNNTHNRLTAFCLGLPGWAGTRRNIQPLTPILIIGHPLSTLPLSTTTHSILFVQFTCFTVLFHNLSPGPLTAHSICAKINAPTNIYTAVRVRSSQLLLC